MDRNKIEAIVKEAVAYAALSVGAPLPQREVDRIAAEAVDKMKLTGGAMPNEWTRKMPSGWRPGYCAICDTPCQQDQHKFVECPFEGGHLQAEEQAQKPTAPGLVEALDECARVLYAIMPIVPTKDNPNVPAAVENAYKQARKALSRYRPAPSSADEEKFDKYMYSRIEHLKGKGVAEAFGRMELEDALTEYHLSRHPSTAKSADRCGNGLIKCRYWKGEICNKCLLSEKTFATEDCLVYPYAEIVARVREWQDKQGYLVDEKELDTILNEFSKERGKPMEIQATKSRDGRYLADVGCKKWTAVKQDFKALAAPTGITEEEI